MAASGLVLHVGSHKGAGFEEVVAQVAEAFERALDDADPAPEGFRDCPILIENAAGAGGTVGRSLEEIEALIAPATTTSASGSASTPSTCGRAVSTTRASRAPRNW